ncbi:OmpA/MotB domain protein [Lacinutrix sp. 5H-3-7-4]|nr:OmpA/MotB domain protein [Lacinutrix sp. 5H-3-7-4]
MCYFVLTHMKLKITTLLFFAFGHSIAQNLVLNSSFEAFKNCPKNKGAFHENVINWSCSNYGSTDYFNNCSKDLGFENYVGFQEPKTGNAYSGIYTFAPASYREYIQTKLVSQLAKGTKYLITFQISLSDCSSHSNNNFGVLFTSEELDSKSKNFIHFKYLKKDNIKYKYSKIENKSFYSNTQEWTKVTLEYTANGFEKFMTIGNFETNRVIKIQEVWSTAERQFTYYYIDDVSVTTLKLSKKTLSKVDKAKPLETKTIYTFKNILFEFDKAILVNTSIEELDKLNLHLKENKNLNIEIYGHTDNIGLAKRNQELSLQRAKSVSEYLISKGLKKERIQWFGFGSSKPLVKNSSEDNRAKNRRVEFKLIDKN